MSAAQQIASQFSSPALIAEDRREARANHVTPCVFEEAAAFAAAVIVIHKSVPTHAELTSLLKAVNSAALSFHEHAGYENSGAVCDGITEAMHALEYCFHRSTT